MIAKAKNYWWTLGLLILAFLALSLVFSPSAFAAEGKHQFMADIDGDTYYDAITFDPGSGDWWAALADFGNPNFNAPARRIIGYGIGSSKQFMADVTGDNKADCVTYDSKSGDWWVAPANGTGSAFTTPSRWIIGHGVGSTNQMLGDINNDNRADAVVFFSNGSWWATISTGTSFGPASQWFSQGFGAGSTRQFVGDVTGDGKADAIVWNSTTADWWFAGSNGTGFVFGPNKWGSGVGIGSSDQYLEDVTFDGRADIVMAFPGPSSRYGGQWWVGTSNGNGFNTATMWHSGFGHGVANVIPGDSSGNYAMDMVTFDAINGDWWVMESNSSSAFVSTSGSRWITGFGVGT